MDLVSDIYDEATRTWPRDEMYGLTSQVRRAAVSVPSNIAEGHTREHLGKYLHHLSMAQASLAEVETQLEIAGRLEYLEQQKLAGLLAQADVLGRQLRSLPKIAVAPPAPSTSHPGPREMLRQSLSLHPHPTPRTQDRD